MGNRLSRITTRTGDTGSTGLGDGTRVSKDSARIEAIGTVDELNCQLGVLLAEALPEAVRSCLAPVQHALFDLGGELCLPGQAHIGEEHIVHLEQSLHAFNSALPPLKDFILPGGDRLTALCHVARAVCRRAERRCWTLSAQESLNPQALMYLNRLSDLLFVIARVLVRESGGMEVLWQSPRSRT